MNIRIKEIRKKTGLSKTEFAKVYGIPLRTVEDWESGAHKCLTYVENLLDRVVSEDLESGRLPGASFKSNPPETVGERLEYLREELLEISLAQLGEKIGITKAAVHQIEKGKVKLSDKNCKLICKAFNVNQNWLVLGDGDPFSS
ncbi:MAG: helix-turn-helix domain-containing protein [Lachnospiraceae bacterium]|nr:helix-turn-helix domain-containing protein [Lachnospiraceae bacterium]